MILPIRTNIIPRQRPYANYILIICNAIVFLLTYSPHKNMLTGSVDVIRPWAEQLMLTPLQPELWQFVSYAFLHGGFMHILGNMYFLYLFGNNVNDKFGNTGYLCFYLAGAVFSGIGHSLLSSSPVLGASGAVAAVTGAYLALFPQSLITVMYWLFFFIGTMELPTLYFICLKMILIDNIIVRYTPNVAYNAHLSGYAFGILAAVGMLAGGLTSRSGTDLYSMLKQYNRRRQHRKTVSAGRNPFTERISKKVKIKQHSKHTAEEPKQQMTELRSRIANRIAQRNLPAAAELYLELVKLDKNQLVQQQYLLDIANQLASENKAEASAMAYEQFLTHYRNYDYIEQVQLMLGILYARYLNQPKRAIKHLSDAAKKLSDPGQLKMCNDQLARLQNEAESGGIS